MINKVVLCLPYGKENISFKNVQRYLNSYILSDNYQKFGFYNWNMILFRDTNVKKNLYSNQTMRKTRERVK